MKIDWIEYEKKEHVLAWFLVEAMSAIGIEKFGAFLSSQIDVEMKVNGLEVPFVEAMEFLQKQLDDIREEGRQQGRNEVREEIIEKVDNWMSEEDESSY